MKKIIESLLLFLPLNWYLQFWNIFLKISLPFSTPKFLAIPFISDDMGVMAGVWIMILFSITFVIASIYTFHKKHWWWFAAYMVLGGIPVGFFFLAGF